MLEMFIGDIKAEFEIVGTKVKLSRLSFNLLGRPTKEQKQKLITQMIKELKSADFL